MSTATEISKALFGGVVDIEALVAKMDPGVSDVHVFGESNRAGTPPLRGRRRQRLVAVRKDSSNSKKFLEASGVGATLIGGALGAREVAEQAQKLGHPGLLHAVSRTGRLMPVGVRSALKNPKVRLGAVGGMLAGDAIATGEQIGHMRSKKPVTKGFNEMVDGIIHGSRLMTAVHAPKIVAETSTFADRAAPAAQKARAKALAKPKATKALVNSYGGGAGAAARLDELRANKATRAATRQVVKPVKRTPVEQGIAAGQSARADLGRMANTTSGKVALGGAGLLGVRHHMAGRGLAPQPYEDPYAGFGKRATDDVTFSGSFSKFDDDKRLAFGWANVSKINGLPVVDRQGDYVSIEDIEEAAYTYVERSRIGGDMHKRIGGKSDGVGDRPHHVADLVESMVFDDAKCESLGLPDDFPRGWWVGFRVFDDGVWNMAKSGERTGFSIHGRGIRKSVDYDDLMGVT